MNLKNVTLPLILSLSFLFGACQESARDRGVGSQIEEAGKDAGKALEDAKKATEEGFDDAGNAVREGINDAGNAIEEAGKSIKDATN
jgi:predicted small secreted protein